MRTATDIVIRPIITEKSLKEAKAGRYTFLVAKDVDAGEIRGALKELYNVDAKEINTNNIKKKKTRLTKLGKKIRDLSYKKARVVLEKSQKIAIFDEVAK
ncbi:MAG: 50S ribosomal protein L23 [Candidatus Levybacteria bacterium RIFCSPHIGHO2_01_FULL_36_15]|nr:MAG: 50S ribosomal protein L23 [Candidatus Levybacteria bacterium RIFCSPHIGHO2_01_FULL_36_15]OGH38355.1 MAG: 50S ribosomal protein L23 [Candidatus Levybacteria bacterium RIFCSPLOWO2_01_FULL_36_10]